MNSFLPCSRSLAIWSIDAPGCNRTIQAGASSQTPMLLSSLRAATGTIDPASSATTISEINITRANRLMRQDLSALDGRLGTAPAGGVTVSGTQRTNEADRAAH